jgi:putative FmdB family regulatory protein
VPIYEYLCESCGRIHEVIHKLDERGPTHCRECGGEKIAKLVSRSAFQLKGGGWYADLYASKKKPAADAGATPGGGAAKAAEKPAPAASASAPAAAGAKPDG